MEHNERRFFFGTAISDHQVSGDPNQLSDWGHFERDNAATWSRRPRDFDYGQGPLAPETWERFQHQIASPEQYISRRAAGHSKRLDEDLDLAAGMGLTAFRFSVEWPRLEPAEGQFDPGALEFVRRVITGCRQRGMEPFITLMHFTLPQWVAAQGGRTNPRTIGWFVRYAEHASQAFGTDVRYIATFNEPEIYAGMGYGFGVWPHSGRLPQLRLLGVTRRIIAAHHRAYARLKAINPEWQIGVCFDHSAFETDGSWRSQAVELLLKYFTNHYFPRRMAASADWLGAQYYFHFRLERGRRRFDLPGGFSDLGWHLYPVGHAAVLWDLARYGLPLFVTESGVADADHNDLRRQNYLRASFDAVLAARQAGVDVRGFFVWSLLDNFEWDKGYWPRFGLYDVDRQTLDRTPRASVATVRELARRAGSLVARR